MKYLFLLLLSSGLQADLDLSIPEQPAVYIPPETFFLNLGDYNESPTKAQKIAFLTLNALDVYTTHQALKKPYVYETNYLLGKNPSLGDLIIHKAVVGGLIYNYSSKNYIRLMNIGLTHAVINNYKIMR
tara:strand:+ start:1671 stop:2057 length:387 start_codon:yes stop_codon:yes gene_type:complete